MDSHEWAGPPLTQHSKLDQIVHRLATCNGPYQFFESSSFTAAISRCASASNCFSFFASDTLKAHLHSTVLRSPSVKRLLADPMLPTQILVLCSCLGFLQNPDDLFFAESFPLHDEFSLVFLRENPLCGWTVLLGGGHQDRLQHNHIAADTSESIQRAR